MKIYLVGGAVRDQLLGYPVEERDWVVVGAAPQDLLDLGYKPVGKDFPVFLHPETKEEYALARTERKTGRGYAGFSFYAAPDVTLEQDLARRDLTINAMAETPEGELIDPFAGQKDLQQKIFRHVSPAFVEDPVRVLRVARFSARFSDFEVAPETLQLMQEIVNQGEMDALVAERVWQEWQRALGENSPKRFFEVLSACNGLQILFGDFPFDIAALQKAAELSLPVIVRFAALLHKLSRAEIDVLCARYRVPREYRDLAVLVSENFASYENILQLDAEDILFLLETLDVFRRPERLEFYLAACKAIFPKHTDDASAFLQKIYALLKTLKSETFVQAGLQGAEIGRALRKKQLEVIGQLLS